MSKHTYGQKRKAGGGRRMENRVSEARAGGVTEEARVVEHLWRERAFTLIELLIVIAVIMILTSLLLPALNRVKLQTKATVCQNQVKQLGLAYLSYVGDSNDWTAPYAESSSGTVYTWVTLLIDGEYVGQRLFYCPTGLSTTHSRSLNLDYYTLYNINVKLGGYADYSQYSHYGYNYLSLGGNGSDTGIFPTKRLGMFKHPSRTIAFADAWQPAYSPVRASYRLTWMPSGYADIHDRHMNSASLDWLDGHVTLEKNARERFQYYIDENGEYGYYYRPN